MLHKRSSVIPHDPMMERLRGMTLYIVHSLATSNAAYMHRLPVAHAIQYGERPRCARKDTPPNAHRRSAHCSSRPPSAQRGARGSAHPQDERPSRPYLALSGLTHTDAGKPRMAKGLGDVTARFLSFLDPSSLPFELYVVLWTRS